MPEIRNVTGIVRDQSGNALPFAEIKIRRDRVYGQGGAVVIPMTTEAVADALGNVAFDLYAGTYSAYVDADDPRTGAAVLLKFTINLSQDGSADLADIIDGPAVPLTPSDVLLVQSLRDETETLRDDTVDAAARTYDTLAALLADTAVYPVGTRLSVRGGGTYEVVASGGDLQRGDGVWVVLVARGVVFAADASSLQSAVDAVAPANIGPDGEIVLVDLSGARWTISTDLVIPSNVVLRNGTIYCTSGSCIRFGGTSGNVHYWSGLDNVTVIGEVSGGVPASVNLVTADYLYRARMHRVSLSGSLGAALYTTTNCRNWRLHDVYAYNACQSVSAITGAIELRGSDHVITGYMIGNAGVTDAEISGGAARIPYACGVLLNMSTATVGGYIRGEISGFAGVYILNSFSTDFGSILADQNAGHGVYIASNCANIQMDVRGSDNNRANGAYDTLNIAAGDVGRYNVRSISTDNLGGIGNPMRAHLYVAASTAVADRGAVAYPTGRLDGAQRMVLPSIGPKIIEGSSKPINFTDGDTTPSVDGGTIWACANSGATSITAFDDGYDGKIITVVADGNTTFVHPGIVSLNGRSCKPTAGHAIKFIRASGTWRQITPLRSLHGNSTPTFPSIAAGGIWSGTITVSGAAFGDIVRLSLSASQQGLILHGYVSAADTITATLYNPTGSAVALGSATIRAFVEKI